MRNLLLNIRYTTALVAGVMALIGLFLLGFAGYVPFLSIEGLVIVVGGSIANAFLSFQREDVLKAFSTIRDMLKKPLALRDGLHKDILQIIGWAQTVQSHDLIGLEKESAKEIQDPLLRYGMDLVITGYSAAHIRDMIHTVSEAEFDRSCRPVTVLRNMAATAPAFGMVGTLIGMVTILNNVGTDLSNIGGGLAIAMLSTLYGILVARLICLPAADKLLQREESNYFRNHMVAEGLSLLAEKQKPFYVQDRLNSFLSPSKQLNLSNYAQIAKLREFAMEAA